MKSSSYIILFLIFISSVQFAQTYSNQGFNRYNSSRLSELWQQMDDIFNDPNFSSSNWGVVIKSLETGEYFYKRNEDRLFIPASNLKLFTTASALLLLEPNYKYKTNIFLDGKIDGSVLKGNLILQGIGDPTFSGRFNHGNVYQIFNDWADSLLARNIDEIAGNLIGDDNLFDDNGLANGWSWEHESYWYSASTSAICFNENCIDVVVKPTAIGNPASLTLLPETRYVTLINKVTTVPQGTGSDLDVRRERGTNIITVFGKIEEGSDEKKVFATINNPTQYAMVVLKDVLQRKGIIVRGYPTDVDMDDFILDYSKMSVIFTYESTSLIDLIKIINKDSQNFYAEQLLKTIGLEEENFGSIENGVKAVKRLFKEMGINPENLIIADGSGLSHLNLVTPRQIINLLSFMYRNDNFTYFYESLPVAGVDGTLAKRMNRTKAENNVRAKTGYSDGVRSLSGYVFTADNEPIAFSIIVNNFIVPASLADNLQDQVCIRLANFSRK